VLYGTLGSATPGAIYSINSDGSNFQILHTFSGTDGFAAEAKLTAVGSTLYGTTVFGGGTANVGTVFSYTVPEPSTLALTGLGAVCIALARSWRLRQTIPRQ
jgi:uncharacterized repeat protein (TIGR03803 family)